jgi:putative nucleotidyltransferase with HDIG domain
VQSNDAFSAGLLHDIGSALVFRRAPRRYDSVIERLVEDPTLTLLEAERDEFGVTHAEVGAAALAVMKFPPELCDAIKRHHDVPAEITTTLGRLLAAADAIAIAVDGAPHEQNAPIAEALEALEIPASAAEALIEEVRRDQENLAGFLTVRG